MKKMFLFVPLFLFPLSPLISQTPEEIYEHGRHVIAKKIARKEELRCVIARLEGELLVELEHLVEYEKELAALKKIFKDEIKWSEIECEEGVWSLAFEKIERLKQLEMIPKIEVKPNNKRSMKLLAAAGGLAIVVAGIFGTWFWNIKSERDVLSSMMETIN